MLRSFSGGLAFAAATFSALPALAQGFPTEPSRLDYQRRPGAESCPGEPDFRSEVAIVRHGRSGDFLPPDPYDDQTVAVDITLERAGSRFRGTITHHPPPGSKARPPIVAVNSECSDLVRDLAFSASFFLPLIKKPPPPPCPVCPPAPAPPPALAPTPELMPVEPPLSKHECDVGKTNDPANDESCKRLLDELRKKYVPPVEPAFWLSTGGLLTLAYTSDVGPGFSFGADARGTHWSVGVEAQVTLPARVTSGAAAEDFDATSFIGMLVPCARWTVARVNLFGCGALGAGGLMAYDSQQPVEQTNINWTIRIGPRLGLELPLGERFAVYAYGEVSFAPIIKHVTYYPSERQWVQNAASGFLGAGISVKLDD